MSRCHVVSSLGPHCANAQHGPQEGTTLRPLIITVETSFSTSYDTARILQATLKVVISSWMFTAPPRLVTYQCHTDASPIQLYWLQLAMIHFCQCY
jgi:hypothetical protein